jgi:hypothetical protein
MTCLQDECSYRRTEEMEDIQRPSSACSHYPPCPAPGYGLPEAAEQGLALVHFPA